MAWSAIGIFVIFALAAHGLGRPLARRLWSGGGLGGFVWAQAIGLAGLVGLAAGLSLVGGLRPWPVGLILCGLAAWGLWQMGRSWPPRLKANPPLSKWEILFLAGIAFYHLTYLCQALSPPSWGEGIHYLFVLARDYGQEGAIYYHPDVYASRPHNMVLLFSLVQLFARAEASQLISWWFGLTATLSVVALGNREIGRTTGLLAGLILSAMPLLGRISGQGMSDSGLLFFGLVGLWGLRLAYTAEGSKAWAALAGVFLGLAAGFKGIGLSVFLVGLAVALFELIRQRRGVKELILVAVVAVLCLGPWYLYSYKHTGLFNFVGPSFAYRTNQADLKRFLTVERPGKETKAEKEFQMVMPPTLKGYRPKTVVGLKVHLKTIFNKGAKLWVRGVTAFWRLNLMGGYRERIVGAFILALAPLILLIRPVPGRLIWLAGVGLAQFYVSNILFGPYARYVMVGLSLLALVGAWGWRSLIGLGGWPRVLAVVVLACCWLPLLPEAGYNLLHNGPVALGSTDRQAYLDRVFGPEMEVYRYANQHLPPEAKVLLIADHRAYYLDREAFYGTPGRNPLIPYYRFRNWQDLERVVRAFGITHVMMNSNISENYWDPAVGRKRDKEYRGWVETLIERDLEPVFCRGSLCLYRFKSPEEPGAAGDQ